MTHASESFFTIPELLESLAPYLAPHDLAQLLRTNRFLNSVFTRYFWVDVTIDTERAFIRLVQSPEACTALYRNIGTIRFLKTRADFFLYYIEGLYAYMDTQPDVTLRHPNYLRRPDTTRCPSITIVPFPPITQLTRLDVNTRTAYNPRTQTAYNFQNPYYFQNAYSSGLPPPVSASTLDLGLSVCWFISLNTGLTHLTLQDEPLRGHFLSRVFARTVSRLSFLQHLEFRGSGEEMALRTFQMIMMTCPASLGSIMAYTYTRDDLHEPFVLDSYDTMEVEEEGPLEVRTEPLPRVKRLHVPWNMTGYSTEVLCRLLELCPIVEAFDVPLLEPPIISTVAKTIKDCWPCLQELTVDVCNFDYHGRGILAISETIDPGLLRVISSNDFSDSWSTRTLDVFQRHSETLREIRFPRSYWFKSRTIQGILTSCRALEHLEVDGRRVFQIKLWLDDMDQDVPWVSTRLRYLKMAVDWNNKRDKPTPLPKDPVVPPVRMRIGGYNEKMHAILASRMRLGKNSGLMMAEDTEPVKTELPDVNGLRRSRLRWFYWQLGRLTELEYLDLKATSGFPEEELSGQLRPYSEFTFPRLLSLSDPSTAEQAGGARGKVGYLSELGQLKKLKVLRGSFRVDRPAVRANMGQREVEFIHDHWPELRRAEFLPNDYETNPDVNIPSHMQWLLERRPWLRLCRDS
ncbi:hypothetical protein BGX23_004889 [Mortierella sp. AD031]|nr:hypothetical protein BGX23_004889 [Mortierella sp. AD031]